MTRTAAVREVDARRVDDERRRIALLDGDVSRHDGRQREDDLGGQGNLIVAMVIATVKAALVVTYFMHLRWDKKFHLILFLTSVLFLILFLSIALTDRSEYEHDIELFRASQAQGQ